MKKIAYRLNAYIQKHPFDSGDSGCETVLEQLYQAYAESHENDPTEIGDGFKELEELLCIIPLENNNRKLWQTHKKQMKKVLSLSGVTRFKR